MYLQSLITLVCFYSTDQRTWLSQKERDDKEQRQFFLELFSFPNFFSLEPYLQHLHKQHEQTRYVIEQQKSDLCVGNLQYDLEIQRCRLVIIFLLNLIGCKQEAWDECETLGKTTGKSFTFLTLKAALEWERGYRTESKQSLQKLKDLQNQPDYDYLRAVAESEKGYLLICIGPKGFLHAIDCFHKALELAPSKDTFLWKYDLAIAIRRNFNMNVYSDHPEHTARILAQECKDMLQDTASNCPNKVYRARSLVELSRLIQHLRCFICACGEEDKAAIEEVMEGIDEDRLMSEAINMEEGRHDFFVLRECGRYFMQKTRDFHGAIWCLMESEKKRKTSLVYSVLAKAYLRMVPHVQFFDPSEAKLENALKPMASGSSVQERQRMFHMDFNARNLSTRMTEPENIHRKPSVKCLLRAAKPRHYELSDPRVQMAEKFYLQGKKLHPRNSCLLSELAKLFEGTGRPEKAVKLYETIIVNREISTAFDVVNSMKDVV
jgi:tetratricopeptide (TPR) repeat protein